MVGLLYALPNTQLTRRLAKEGRLHPTPDHYQPDFGDQCTQGLNFDTLRPRQDILLDYKRILEKVYDPATYAARLERLTGMLDNSHRKRRTSANDANNNRFSSTDMVQRIVVNLPEPRAIFWPTFKRCVSSNPQSARWIVALTAVYLHLGPFSRYVIGKIEQKIDDLAVGAIDPRARRNSAPIEAAVVQFSESLIHLDGIRTLT
jgi:hypothetical protein